MRRLMIFGIGVLGGLALAFAVPAGRAHDADTIAASAPQKNPLFINMPSWG